MPFQPWAREFQKKVADSFSSGRTSERCLPSGIPQQMLVAGLPFKIVQTPGLVLTLFEEFIAAGNRIASCYEKLDFAAAIREIMQLTDRANLYLDQHKPWLLAKDPANAALVQQVCTQGLNLFRVLAGYLQPVLPDLVRRAEEFLRSVGEAERGRYFTPDRLAALDLPGAPRPGMLDRALRPAGGSCEITLPDP